MWEAAPNKLRLSADEVHVWRASLNVFGARLQSALATLSESERLRANRFRFPVHQRQFVAARAILRDILSRYLEIPPRDVPLGYRNSGKPFVDLGDRDGSIRFNLAHSGDLAIYAIARDRSVGVDVERMRRDVAFEDLADRFFAPVEAAALHEIPKSVRAAAFFSVWTRKEAYLKAGGDRLTEGIAPALGRFSVTVEPGPVPIQITVRDEPEETGRWSILHLEVAAGFAAALAVEGSARTRRYEWRA